MKFAILIYNSLNNQAVAELVSELCTQMTASDSAYLYLYGPAVAAHNLPAWQRLRQPNITLSLCVSAWVKQTGFEGEQPPSNLNGFAVVGLGAWWQHALSADCLIQFTAANSHQQTRLPPSPQQILVTTHHAPNAATHTEDAIACALAAGAMEQTVSLCFMGRSIHTLVEATGKSAPKFAYALKAAELYNLHPIYVCADDLNALKLCADALIVPVTVVERRALQSLTKRYTITLDF